MISQCVRKGSGEACTSLPVHLVLSAFLAGITVSDPVITARKAQLGFREHEAAQFVFFFNRFAQSVHGYKYLLNYMYIAVLCFFLQAIENQECPENDGKFEYDSFFVFLSHAVL